MKVRYLGTGGAEGIPSLFCECRVCLNAREKGGRDVRHRSSVMIDTDTLVDMSADTFSQSVSLGLNLAEVRQILFTHTHPDHFYLGELFWLLPQLSTRHGRPPVKICLSDEAYGVMKNQFPAGMFEAFEAHLDIVRMKAFQPYDIVNATVTPLAARHDGETPFLYIIERDGRRLLYGNDSGFFPEETWDFMYGKYFDFVSLDCASGLGGGTVQHMGLEDNLTVKKRMFQQKSIDHKTVFVSTHFSHMADATFYELDESLRLSGFKTAYDGMEVTI